ncbi:ABC transporter ATP-binding protein [candidate division KSB1 bacterium]|nr:ABC transporter ATP-binding protein [candidate division KSB1 bacterium]
MTALQIDNLSKRYGTLHALREVSFAVESGEIFGYLGPNGAGKTTTLRAILGLVRAEAGEVRLFGEKIGRAENRAEIGFLPGELHLYGNMTGAALLNYFAGFRPQQPPKLRPKLLDALEVDYTVLARRVKFLSHGTKQKLGLVIAMQHDPRLLLLDEPTLGLDPLMQQALHELLLDCAKRGRAVLFSSHILSEVKAICHRAAILRAGELVAVESLATLREKMIRRLHVRFRSAVPKTLAQTAGIVRAHFSEREATLWVQGDINPMLRCLAASEVEHLVFPEPELEDIFMSYFQPQEQDCA